MYPFYERSLQFNKYALVSRLCVGVNTDKASTLRVEINILTNFTLLLFERIRRTIRILRIFAFQLPTYTVYQ